MARGNWRWDKPNSKIHMPEGDPPMTAHTDARDPMEKAVRIHAFPLTAELLDAARKSDHERQALLDALRLEVIAHTHHRLCGACDASSLEQGQPGCDSYDRLASAALQAREAIRLTEGG